MNTILETLYLSRELHSILFSPICAKYRLTVAELLVLLFLSNHQEYDTAKDIVKKLKLAKSHVSVSVHELEQRGYLHLSADGHDRRSVHLQVCDPADEIISDVKDAQSRFLSILGQGLSQEEMDNLMDYMQRASDNMTAYLKNAAVGKAGR